MIGGCLSFAIALLHVVIIFGGAPAYRYFDTGEQVAKLAESGSLLPAMLTLGVAAVFAVFGIYAFSGAELIRRLPFLAVVLILIGAVYALRGLFLVHEIMMLMTSKAGIVLRKIVFSLVSLAIGVVYLMGTMVSWRRLNASN